MGRSLRRLIRTACVLPFLALAPGLAKNLTDTADAATVNTGFQYPSWSPYNGTETWYATRTGLPGSDGNVSVSGIGTWIGAGGLPSIRIGLPDYLATYAYFTGLVQVESGAGSAAGGTAAVWTTRTKNNPSGVGYAAPDVAWFFNDSASFAIQGAGRYTEARDYPTVTGPALAQESEISEFRTSVGLNPYSVPAFTGLSANLWLGSGGGCAGSCFNPLTSLSNLTPADSSGAINIFNNGAKFRVGINFAAGALTNDANGTGGGFAPMIQGYNGSAIVWDSPDGTQKAAINSSETNTGYGNSIAFANEAIDLFGHLQSSVATGKTQPAAVTCGTSPSVDANATDTKGVINVGTGTVSSCQLNFGTSYTSTPVCVLTSYNQGYALGLSSIANTGFIVAFTPSVTTTEHVYYICVE